MQDAITGYLVTASARALEVLLLTAGIVAGVALALDVGAAPRGRGRRSRRRRPSRSGQVPVQVLAAAVAVGRLRGRQLRAAPHAAAAAAGRGARLGALLGSASRSGCPPALSERRGGRASSGSAATCWPHRQKAPPLVYVAAGIIPLLPGLTIYRGMLRLADGDTLGGLVDARPARSPSGWRWPPARSSASSSPSPRGARSPRFERRLAGPRLAGPLRLHGEDAEEEKAEHEAAQDEGAPAPDDQGAPQAS